MVTALTSRYVIIASSRVCTQFIKRTFYEFEKWIATILLLEKVLSLLGKVSQMVTEGRGTPINTGVQIVAVSYVLSCWLKSIDQLSVEIIYSRHQPIHLWQRFHYYNGHSIDVNDKQSF